ncbi:MAG: iron-containing alcohol dehydrogenase [Candidatus Latescibacteria bacterium]|jgi:alcohol dehydrogenase|nr:iron-containing alcohol dehydrogenase [Candidatus Latescibacterota bacterium]
MNSFDFYPTTRVIFGEGTLTQLGKLAVELGGKRILLVTDPGIVSAGLADRAIASLRDASLDIFMFDGTGENPTTDHVNAGVAFAKTQGNIDLIVALGGGSAMDCAKGINFILTNGGQIEDYHGMGHAQKPMLPSIGIPTTAGTGSEAQSYALIANADTHMKMACGDLKARFRIVVLDPSLIKSVPRHVVAATGIDAIAHAIESYVSTRRNAVSQMFAQKAWQLLSSGFETILSDPSNDQTQGNMLLGAHLAGAAIENAMLGAAHACANPLTAHYGITHGIAVGLMLPAVILFNGETEDTLYQGLGQNSQELAQRISALKEKANLPIRLRDQNVDQNRLIELAQDATKQWTGTFNPRPLSKNDFLKLYETAY